MEENQQDMAVLEDAKDPELEEIQDSPVKQTLQTVIAQKKHWREKAVDPETGKTYKELYAEAKKSASTPQPTSAAPEVTDRVARLEEVEDRRQFGHRYGYSPDETDRIFAYAKGLGKKPDEVKTDPFIETAINVLRTQEKVKQATPRSTPGGSVSVDGKPFASMTKAERRASWGKITGTNA